MKTLKEFWKNADGVYYFIDKNGNDIDNVDCPLDTKILNERHIENEEYEITLDIEF